MLVSLITVSNQSKNIYGKYIKSSKLGLSMESSMAGFLKSFAELLPFFLFLEERLGTRLCLRSVLSF